MTVCVAETGNSYRTEMICYVYMKVMWQFEYSSDLLNSIRLRNCICTAVGIICIGVRST